MPNRYLPSALAQMVDERYESMFDLDERDGDDYPSEYEALVAMLKPEHQQEFRNRHGGTNGQ